MRTKALLLAAAFAAAGVATSVAQVYSVNAVGYVNTTLVPGFNMVSNPLDAGTGNNTAGKLISGIQGGVPVGTRIFVFNPTTGAFNQFAQYVNTTLGFQPAASANLEVLPGNGMFVFIPGTAPTQPNVVCTFVGEVKQGDLVNPLPQGFSIKANQVPQAGKPDSLGLVGTPGDRIYRFNPATGAYFQFNQFVNATLGWQPATASISVGEAFFMFRATSAGSWNRTFNVNNPA